MSAGLTGTTLKLKPGAIIIRENEKSRQMFLIKDGKVRVYKKYLGQKVTLAVLGKGEVFGELSFFDAQPRSASIEAMTEVVVLAIDGDAATSQLPVWVMPLLRTAFFRFREADQKITVLQSINEFQKKNFGNDTVAKTIYMELLRFIKTLTLLYTRDQAAHGEVKSETIQQEMDDMLGNRFIGLRVFWRLLKEHDFIDSALEENEGKVALNSAKLESWNDYLAAEIQRERYLMLGHATLALIRRILGYVDEEGDSPGGQAPIVNFTDIQIDTLPLAEQAVKELKKDALIEMTDQSFIVNPSELSKLYTYQSIVKAFDHTIINLE